MTPSRFLKIHLTETASNCLRMGKREGPAAFEQEKAFEPAQLYLYAVVITLALLVQLSKRASPLVVTPAIVDDLILFFFLSFPIKSVFFPFLKMKVLVQNLALSRSSLQISFSKFSRPNRTDYSGFHLFNY